MSNTSVVSENFAFDWLFSSFASQFSESASFVSSGNAFLAVHTISWLVSWADSGSNSDIKVFPVPLSVEHN